MDEDQALSAPHPHDASDSEEDMPDYGVLSKIAQRRPHADVGNAPAPSIPKRGEKDFEPTGFGGQAKLLDKSRSALFSAIATQRAHSSKTLSTATWDPVFGRAFVHAARGQACATVGVTERRAQGRGEGTRMHATLELLPEETVYLIERGALDCRWSLTPGAVPSAEEHARSIPLSVQQAYTQVLGVDGCTSERYQMYAYLKRLGYIVQRASAVDQARSGAAAQAHRANLWPRMFRALAALLRTLTAPLRWLLRVVQSFWRRQRSSRSLLGIRADDTYDDVFRALQIVPSGDRAAPRRTPRRNAPNELLAPFFYAWRPATHYRRTAPPPPEFRIVVLDTSAVSLLGLGDFRQVFAHIPLPGAEEDEQTLQAVREQNRRAYGKQKPARPARGAPRAPEERLSLAARLLELLRRWLTWLFCGARRTARAPAQGNVYVPLKSGRRNVVVAIADQGTTSLLRFGEAEFARWALAGRGR